MEDQQPFDLDGERANPEWGDPSFRLLPSRPRSGSLRCSHLHINTADIEVDHNIALPSEVLSALARENIVGTPAPHHVSVMGYQAEGLGGWRTETVPEIVKLLEHQKSDGVVLAPV